MTTILQLCAAHLLAAFVLAPMGRRWTTGKPGRASLFLVGCEVASGIAMVNLGLSRRVLAGLLLLALLHGVIHYVARWPEGTWKAFAGAQVMHLGLAAGTGALLAWGVWPDGIAALRRLLGLPHLYLYVAVYAGVVLGGGVLVQRVTESFLDAIDEKLLQQKPGLPKAGALIGWLERLLVLTFVQAGANEAIGFLLAVKALVRYPEIKDDTKGVFGEYFLVGTFTSMGVALIGGLLLRALAGNL
jgi:hypothetical protein